MCSDLLFYQPPLQIGALSRIDIVLCINCAIEKKIAGFVVFKVGRQNK